MSQKPRRPPATAAFLIIGIAFITIGISNSSAFIPIGCAFIVIGIAGIANSRRASRDDALSDDGNND